MPSRIATPALWCLFTLLFVLATHRCLTACDLAVGPLFGLRYCSTSSAFASDLDREEARQAVLQEALHQAQLRVAQTPACAVPERHAEVPQTRTEPRRDTLKIPSTLSQLSGCWQSDSGDIQMSSDDERHEPLGKVRICFCFNGAGTGSVIYKYTDGRTCQGSLKADLAAQSLTIDHPRIDCPGNQSVVPIKITCHGTADEAATCDIENLGRIHTTTTDQRYHHVDNAYCGN